MNDYAKMFCEVFQEYPLTIKLLNCPFDASLYIYNLEHKL